MKNKEYVGVVSEVFIPVEYDGMVVDVMDSDKIGFKVIVDNREITIINQQDEYNCDILRNDKVRVIESYIDGEVNYDIYKLEDDYYV